MKKINEDYFKNSKTNLTKPTKVMEVLVGRIYKHFKGDYYIVENIALHTETEENMVIYKALYGDGRVFARPYSSFVQEINDANQKHRFELQEIKSVNRR